MKKGRAKQRVGEIKHDFMIISTSLAMLKYVKLSKNKSGWAEGRISADTGTTSYFYWVISNTQVKI